MILNIILFFILGIIFGSFFNVVGLRVPKKEPFVNGRSMCPKCQHMLSWYELIPIFSYIFLLGRCRHCRSDISIMYPASEVVTGFLFALSYVFIGLNLELVVTILLMSMLIIILVADIHYMLIPDRILLFFLPLFITLRMVERLDPWWSPVIGSIVGFSLIAVIIIVSRGGMGAGDMKLFTVLGVVLGIKMVLLTFFLACIIGAVCGIFLLLFKQIDRKQLVPFGPYIVLATITAHFHGESLLHWYFQFLI